MENKKSTEIDRKKIILLNTFISNLEPLIIRLADWGYDTISVRDSNELNNSPRSQIKEIALIDLSGELSIDALVHHKNLLKQRIPKLSTIGVYSGKMKTPWHQIYKLNLEGVFHFPLEEDLFLNRLFEICPVDLDIKKLGIDALVKAQIAALDKIDALPFDVFIYLVANQRVVMLRKNGSPLESQMREKFKLNPQWHLYIRKSDLMIFQKDLGKKLFSEELTKEFKSDNTDNTDNTDKLTESPSIQEQLHSTLLSFFSEEEYTTEEAEQTVQNLRSALDQQMTAQELTFEKWQKSKELIQGKLTYLTHSQNVASYSALFGKALGFKQVHELALAGLLHDVGLAELPADLLWKPEKLMNAEEKAQYSLHPGFAKHTLQKTLPLTTTVIDAILYHHERMDGSGYPYGLKSDKIPLAAKIVALADEFDKQTSLRPGFPQLTPREAIIKLAGLEGNPVHPVFDPELFKPIVDLFYQSPKKGQKSSASAEAIGLSLNSWLKQNPIKKEIKKLPNTGEIQKFNIQLMEHFKNHL